MAGSSNGTPSQIGASFSNQYNTDTATDNSNNTAALGNGAQGTALNASDGGTITYNGSDYGAVAGALSLAGSSVATSAQLAASTIAGNNSLTALLAKEAEDTVQQQGAGALQLITKPFIWVAAIVGAIIVLGIYLWKR